MMLSEAKKKANEKYRQNHKEYFNEYYKKYRKEHKIKSYHTVYKKRLDMIIELLENLDINAYNCLKTKKEVLMIAKGEYDE